MTVATGNRQLAARAKEMADRSSMQRRAWLCASVALDTTRTLAAARTALAEIRDDDVRDLAAQLLEQLATEQAPADL